VWVLAETASPDLVGHTQEGGLQILRYRLGQTRVSDLQRHRRHIGVVEGLLKQHFPGVPDVLYGHDLLQYTGASRHFGREVPAYYWVHSPAVLEAPINWRTQGVRGRAKIVMGTPVIRRLEEKVLKSSQGVQIASEFLAGLLREEYGDETFERLTLIPGWVDTERFKLVNDVGIARRELGWPVDTPLLFVLRRLAPRMGLENLILAISRIRSSAPAFKVVIGGTGSEAHKLKTLSKQLGVSDTIEFMGQVPDPLVPLAFGASDASLVPTSQLECFGLIALEGMACGRPVLVTPIGALPEIVGAFEPDWVSPSASPDGIASHIQRFLAGELTEHVPLDARGYVVDKYEKSAGVSRSMRFLGLDTARD
jgi:glycosyltransferase involved in cell wall biosynthesis